MEQVRAELSETLEELRAGLDDVLAGARRRLDEWDHAAVADTTTVTPDVGGALWDLLRSMPGVMGNALSGEDERVERARARLGQLDGRLRGAGLELGAPFTGYGDRLAALRHTPARSPHAEDVAD
jgi:hypothetical protein